MYKIFTQKNKRALSGTCTTFGGAIPIMEIIKSGDFTHNLFGKLTVLESEKGLYFVGKEVAQLLNYSNPLEAIREHCKGVSETLLPTKGGLQTVKIIPESDLYRLIIRSKKQEAEVFENWVVSEVLPSIRKNGIYATPVTIENMLSNPDFAIELLQNLKQEREARIEAQNKVAILTHVNNLYVATEIAKEIGFKSAQQLNRELENRGIQYKVNNTYVFAAKYSGLGYESIKQEVLDSGKIVYHRKFTQLGREFILSVFAK